MDRNLHSTRFTGGGDPLRRCNHCFKSEASLSTKLKKCGACSVALYCSSQCQRQAWAIHKLACRIRPLDADADSEVAPYGYTSANAFQRDLKDFITSHGWALSGSSRMLCSLHRARQELLNDAAAASTMEGHTPGLVVLRLHCRSTARSHVHDPATKFAILEQSLESIEEYIREQPAAWDRAAPLREEMDRRHQGTPQYDGVLTVLYYVPGITTCVTLFAPVWKPSPSHFTATERMLMLEDMVEFCVASINDGFPLRRIREDQEAAVPGT
ncbi:hypothetical protein C8Q80DRAFT_1358372 [Daedaleopsis nitida]|nr:hypothetical protein C8Q80DRAFT_1358372 [Daedaleopsis nitida]